MQRYICTLLHGLEGRGMIFQNLSHCARSSVTCSCTTWQVTDQKSPVGQVVRETRANWEKATADLPKVNTVLI